MPCPIRGINIFLRPEKSGSILFSGCPIVEKNSPLGVLVVQSRTRRHFSRAEIRLLKAIAPHVSNGIIQARLLETLKTKEREREESQQRMVDAIKRLRVYERSVKRKAAQRRGGRTRLSGIAARPALVLARPISCIPKFILTRYPNAQIEHPDEEICNCMLPCDSRARDRRHSRNMSIHGCRRLISRSSMPTA